MRRKCHLVTPIGRRLKMASWVFGSLGGQTSRHSHPRCKWTALTPWDTRVGDSDPRVFGVRRGGEDGRALKTLVELVGKGLTYWDRSWYCCSVMVFHRVTSLGRKGSTGSPPEYSSASRGYRGGWGNGCWRAGQGVAGPMLVESAENLSVSGFLKAHRPLRWGEGMGAQGVLEEVPVGGSTRPSGSPAEVDWLAGRTSGWRAGPPQLTRLPPTALEDQLQHRRLLVGEYLFNTSRGGLLAFKLKGRDTVPEGPSIRRWLCSRARRAVGLSLWGWPRSSGPRILLHPLTRLGALRCEAALTGPSGSSSGPCLCRWKSQHCQRCCHPQVVLLSNLKSREQLVESSPGVQRTHVLRRGPYLPFLQGTASLWVITYCKPENYPNYVISKWQKKRTNPVSKDLDIRVISEWAVQEACLQHKTVQKEPQPQMIGYLAVTV